MKPQLIFLVALVCLFSVSALDLNTGVNITPSAANVTYINLVNTTGITSLAVTNTTFLIDLLSFETYDSTPVYFAYNPTARTLFVNYTSSKNITLTNLWTVGNEYNHQYDVFFNGTQIYSNVTAYTYLITQHGEWFFKSNPPTPHQATFNKMIDIMSILIVFFGLLIVVGMVSVVFVLFQRKEVDTNAIKTMIWIFVLTALLIGIAVVIFSFMGEIV